MNKKQLIVIWMAALAHLFWGFWAAGVIMGNRADMDALIKKMPQILRANLMIILPLLIIACVLIVILKDKEP